MVVVTSTDGSNPGLTAGPPAAQAGGILTVDLSAIEANWRALGRRAMPAECAAVVKADGYGCGLEPVGKRLARAGCKSFFVADLAEARRLRAALPDPAIYVLNGLLPNTAAAFAEINARPVIGSMAELAEWDAFCVGSGWHGGAALHVDTGMNRLGISADDAAALAPRIRAENHGITLADEPSRLRRHARASAQSETDRAVPRGAASLSRHPLLARGVVRHLPRQCRALRHDPPRRGFVRRQSDARQSQPDAARHRAQGARHAGAQHRQGRDRRLWRRVDGAACRAHRHRRRWLWRRLPALRERDRRGAGRPTCSSPESAARSPAASRWI